MKTNLKRGYISILAVVTLSSIMLLMLTASFRYTLQNQETQKKTQIRVDYTNREQALLRAVLTEAPNSAMKNMMARMPRQHRDGKRHPKLRPWQSAPPCMKSK